MNEPLVKVYSPSSTITYHEGAAKWALRYIEKYEPRKTSKADLSRIAGSGFHAGIGAWRKGLATPEKAADLAYTVVEKTILEREEKNFQYESDLIEQVETLPALVHITLLRFIEADPIPKDWKLIDVDPWLQEYACRPDEVWEVPSGAYTFVDYKFKPRLDKKYHAETLVDFDYDWQMYHYAWAVPLAYSKVLYDYHVGLVVAAPRFTPYLQAYTVDKENMRLWVKSSRQDWEDMAKIETGERYPAHNFVWRGRWGRDPYADAFTSCRLDPQLLREKYIKTGD